MSTGAKRFLTKFYRDRGQWVPLTFSKEAVADLMEAYWQKHRESAQTKRLDKEVAAMQKLVQIIKKKQP